MGKKLGNEDVNLWGHNEDDIDILMYSLTPGLTLAWRTRPSMAPATCAHLPRWWDTWSGDFCGPRRH